MMPTPLSGTTLVEEVYENLLLYEIDTSLLRFFVKPFHKDPRVLSADYWTKGELKSVGGG